MHCSTVLTTGGTRGPLCLLCFLQKEDNLESMMLFWQLHGEPHPQLHFVNPAHKVEELVAISEAAAAAAGRRTGLAKGGQPAPLVVEAYERYEGTHAVTPFVCELSYICVVSGGEQGLYVAAAGMAVNFAFTALQGKAGMLK